MLAAVIAVIVLLREVLLPFVAGLVLAYLLNPLASRIERLGMNRFGGDAFYSHFCHYHGCRFVDADTSSHSPRA